MSGSSREKICLAPFMYHLNHARVAWDACTHHLVGFRCIWRLSKLDRPVVKAQDLRHRWFFKAAMSHRRQEQAPTNRWSQRLAKKHYRTDNVSRIKAPWQTTRFRHLSDTWYVGDTSKIRHAPSAAFTFEVAAEVSSRYQGIFPIPFRQLSAGLPAPDGEADCHTAAWLKRDWIHHRPHAQRRLNSHKCLQTVLRRESR